MGRAVVAATHAAPGCVLAAALERSGSPVIGADCGDLIGVGPMGVAATDDTVAFYQAADVVIDFSVPDATVAAATAAAAAGAALVSGTTGLTPDQHAAVAAAAGRVAIVSAPNMSLGMNVMFAITQRVAATLDDAYDIEIVEIHHNRKVDAPSGTALGLGRAAAAGRNVDLDDRQVLSRAGHTGPRTPGDIGFATLRGGNAVGDHTVMFCGDNERIELTHRATGREIYANGAIHAALWAVRQPPGLYDMLDVLDLKSLAAPT